MKTHVEVIRTDADGIATFAFVGQLDMVNCEEAFSPLYGVLEEKETHGISIDFLKLKYINSTGIGYVADLFSELEAAGKSMEINWVVGEVADAIKITGLEDMIPISWEN